MFSFVANFIIFEYVKHLGDQGQKSPYLRSNRSRVMEAATGERNRQTGGGGGRDSMFSFVADFINFENVKHFGDQGQKSMYSRVGPTPGA